MSTKLIIFIFAIILIAALAAGGLRRGPRVTQIDRTVRRKKDSGDA
jgi:archaellum component FlaG (FlaF/FlaG flagellin family)